ncbi:hypothetical protein SAMN02910275_02504 [Butyrivibrio sp. INlla18]|uniref:nickel pincer cofactor biosynthesis protein LarC n=1 Tax=Butyrivibrio sp. INlla18 TaxID=1520806 RepID=UPI00088CABD9|nr:nickel pincer cofactor biosynthesis protein LarC [Butyrivibrio sp. INlla18]SDA73973.1 hypothetical protein SAMN02910275_02504 [Butyrivibrio sp. INlla18]
MKSLYIECKMGIAGDMLTAALIDLYDDASKMVNELNKLGIPHVDYVLEDSNKAGIKGKHMRVMVHGQEEGELLDDHKHDSKAHSHHHRHLSDIEQIIEGLSIDRDVKKDIKEVYKLLAEAESKVHGVAVPEIHFHEVGNLDAIADITAACYLIHCLSVDRIIVSPINVGSGTVKAAHGILPVPTPATAVLLAGIPYYESETIKTELCTPTGAALVKYFATDSGVQPVMKVSKIGYGMGKKEFEQVNCVRTILGETEEDKDQVLELSCNIDDMTPEEIGFAMDRFFEVGALDVFTTAIGMKKNRPGILLTCMCRSQDRDKVVAEIFKNTTTIGIRESVCNRYVLAREVKKNDTPYGEIRVKRSYGYGVDRVKPEYDDLVQAAKKSGKSLLEIKKDIAK